MRSSNRLATVAFVLAASIVASSSLDAQRAPAAAPGRTLARTPGSYELCAIIRGHSGGTNSCVRFERGCPRGLRSSRQAYRRGEVSFGWPEDFLGDMGNHVQRDCPISPVECRTLSARYVAEFQRISRLPRSAEGERRVLRPDPGTTLTLRLDTRTLARHGSEAAGLALWELLEASTALCR